MSAIVATIVLGALGSILAAEFLGWCPVLAERLVNCAVNRLDKSHRERYRNEWLADLDVMRIRGGVSLLIWAVGLYLVAGRVASALRPAEEIHVKRHRHPTLMDAIRASKFILSNVRSSPNATREDRVFSHPMLRPVVLPLAILMAWSWARTDRRMCQHILRLANTARKPIE